MREWLGRDLLYVLLVFGLFIVPKYLQRFRVPGAISCVALGAAGALWSGLPLTGDPVVGLLATLGIVAMFLFAGIEVDFQELRRGAGFLAQHLALQGAAISLTALVAGLSLGLAPRPAALVALALISPSTGFILDSLSTLCLTDTECFWVKTKAIAIELVALAALFFTLQTETPQRFALSAGILVAMILVLPLLFRFFAAFILPHAPKTEFAFLVIAALLCASITKKLGVYYLVGAFVVGLTAQRLRSKLPAVAPRHMIVAVELFASFFIPFYFFRAGTSLTAENFGSEALILGGVFFAAAVPARVGMVALHRYLGLKEPFRKSLHISVATLPTLVFTLVIAEILRDGFSAPPTLVGGLVIYALANTMIPGLCLKLPPPQYEEPRAMS